MDWGAAEHEGRGQGPPVGLHLCCRRLCWRMADYWLRGVGCRVDMRRGQGGLWLFPFIKGLGCKSPWLFEGLRLRLRSTEVPVIIVCTTVLTTCSGLGSAEALVGGTSDGFGTAGP